MKTNLRQFWTGGERPQIFSQIRGSNEIGKIGMQNMQLEMAQAAHGGLRDWCTTLGMYCGVGAGSGKICSGLGQAAQVVVLIQISRLNQRRQNNMLF